MENILTSLKLECTLAGTNITEVCREAGVSRSTIDKWEKELPKSFRIAEKLKAAIREIAARNGKSLDAIPN